MKRQEGSPARRLIVLLMLVLLAGALILYFLVIRDRKAPPAAEPVTIVGLTCPPILVPVPELVEI